MLTRKYFPAFQKTEILPENPVSETRNHTLVPRLDLSDINCTTTPVLKAEIRKKINHYLIMFKLSDAEVPKINAPLPVFVQQAAAAKTIG